MQFIHRQRSFLPAPFSLNYSQGWSGGSGRANNHVNKRGFTRQLLIFIVMYFGNLEMKLMARAADWRRRSCAAQTPAFLRSPMETAANSLILTRRNNFGFPDCQRPGSKRRFAHILICRRVRGATHVAVSRCDFRGRLKYGLEGHFNSWKAFMYREVWIISRGRWLTKPSGGSNGDVALGRKIKIFPAFNVCLCRAGIAWFLRKAPQRRNGQLAPLGPLSCLVFGMGGGRAPVKPH